MERLLKLIWWGLHMTIREKTQVEKLDYRNEVYWRRIVKKKNLLFNFHRTNQVEK